MTDLDRYKAFSGEIKEEATNGLSWSDKQKRDGQINAMHEANRFVRKAEKALLEMQNADYQLFCGNKHVAAAKRASMDLTRALVAVRNPKGAD